MGAVNRSEAVKDSVILIRDLLSGTITDPVTNRAITGGSNARFVMTGWAERNVVYPVITVENTGWATRPLGTSTTETLATQDIEINVWSLNRSTTDSLAGSVVAVLEHNQPVTRASGLYDMRIEMMNNIDEPGARGIHRKVIEISYIYPSQP